MKVRFFQLNKNKKYNYTPRHFQEETSRKNTGIHSRIRTHREEINENRMDAYWQETRLKSRNRKNRSWNFTIIALFLILLLTACFILDFDFSIFLKKR